MLLVELVKDRATKEPAPDETLAIIKAACRKGVIAMRAGLFTNGIRFLPPLVITDDQLHEGLGVIEQALTEVEAGLAATGAGAERLQPAGRPDPRRLADAPERGRDDLPRRRAVDGPGGHPAATALAVAGGRIIAVGAGDEVIGLRGPGTRMVDLAGQTLLPGFVDAHAHIWKIGHLLTTLLDVRGVEASPPWRRGCATRPAGCRPAPGCRGAATTRLAFPTDGRPRAPIWTRSSPMKKDDRA